MRETECAPRNEKGYGRGRREMVVRLTEGEEEEGGRPRDSESPGVISLHLHPRLLTNHYTARLHHGISP